MALVVALDGALPHDLLDMIVCMRVHKLEAEAMVILMHGFPNASKLRAERHKLVSVGYPEDDPLVLQFDGRIEHLLTYGSAA